MHYKLMCMYLCHILSISYIGLLQQSMSSYIMQMKVKSEYYLKTRSEAWLDLEPSQLWCFSWALASFSAAAIGHPDRLKWESDCSGMVEHVSENLKGENVTLNVHSGKCLAC